MNYVLAFSILLVNILQWGQWGVAEPFTSSRANITPVRLISRGTATRNRSFSGLQRKESPFSSLAKISRVVPKKHFASVTQVKKSENTNDLANMEKVISSKPKAVLDGESRLVDKRQAQSQIIASKSKSTTKSPLILSADSWDYLNLIVTDHELRQVMGAIPEEIIRNVTNITKRDPVAGQNYLFNSIINELNMLKFPRTARIDDPIVNTGVRFSAKRKPVLNVKTPAVLSKQNDGVKSVLESENSQRNVSGHISNIDNKIYTRKNTTTINKSLKDNEALSNNSRPFSTRAESTTPTLMNVLAVPSIGDADSTTFTPSVPSNSKNIFMPIISRTNDMHLATLGNDSSNSNWTPTTGNSSTVRKARGPPKEDEYSIIAITSTEGPVQENKGYQTIPESTTAGPQVIWYHHNQTPEDTFFPNADGFLVPPEEASIEILNDLSLKPVHEDPPVLSARQPSFIYSEPSSYSPAISRGNGDSSATVLKELYEMGQHVSIPGRNNKEFLLSPKHSKTNKNLQLQQAAATDHNRIRDFEDYSKNGGSDDHHDSRRYGSSSSYKHNDLPEYQEINGKPPYLDGTVSYGALNEYDHYHYSYPNKHEISQYHSISGDHPKDYYKGAPPMLPQDSSSNNGHNRDESPSSDADYRRRPPVPKENSPGWGNHHNNNNHGHGWKDDNKDFITKAKDYFKNSDLSTVKKWFEFSLGILAFLAFAGYIFMLLYQVITIGSGTSIGLLVGRSFSGAEEMVNLLFSSSSPIGHAYVDELETIVRRAMANVKRTWMTSKIARKEEPKVKGEIEAK